MAELAPIDPAQAYSVLIVEDDQVLRQTCALTLRTRRMIVFQAENGEEGLELFRQHPIQAILLDAVMPVMDGFETCRRIRATPRGENIPILMITGLDDAASINRAYDVGATDFIPKPLHLGILAQRLTRLIEASLLEEKLRNKRLQFDFIYQALPDAAVFSRLDRSIMLVNPAFCRQFGYSEREVINRNIAMLYEDMGTYRDNVEEMDRLPPGKDRLMTWTIPYRRKDGRIFTGETTVVFVHDEDGRDLGHLRMIRDVSERIAREAEIAARTAELQAITEHAPEMIARVDHERRFIYVNHALEEFSGRPAAQYLGKTPEELAFSERLCRIWNKAFDDVLYSGLSQLIEFELERDGETLTLQALVAPERRHGGEVETLIIFARDISESKRSERERVISDRMKTLGVLAGGVAHDFNNFITALNNHVTLAQMELEPDSPAAKYLAECSPALVEAMQLSQQLLTFAKGGQPIKKLVDLGPLVRSTAQFALRGLKTVPHFELTADLWAAELDEGQIVQVVTNLLINADQAMPQGGEVLVRLHNRHLTEEEVAGLAEGPYVCLEVEDHGSGIPAENLSKIFDPYFTTKATGNGLGLATVFSILSRHGGHISVRSALGKGTCFTCLLPASPERPLPTRSETVPTAHVGQGRILLLEDQDIIRRGLSRMLGQVNYEVAETVRGEQTLEMIEAAEAAGKPFDLIILDLTIPGGLGGQEVIRRLRERGSTVKAIVSSGYADDPVMARPAEFGFDGVLPKPFMREDLLRVVSEVLQAPARQPETLA